MLAVATSIILTGGLLAGALQIPATHRVFSSVKMRASAFGHADEQLQRLVASASSAVRDFLAAKSLPAADGLLATVATRTVGSQPETASETPASPPPSSAVVNNYITERTIERVIEHLPNLGDFVLRTEYDARLAALDTSLRDLLYRYVSIPNSAPASGGFGNMIALTNRIDNLSNVELTNISVDGVSGLTDADIPDSITASHYLPLTGGVISGDLLLAGTITANVSATTSSSTALIATYATTTNLFAENGSITNATSSSLYATIARFGTAIIDTIASLTISNLIASNATTTNATTTNFAVTSLASALLATDARGRLVSTTTVGTNYLAGALGVINGTTFNRGDSITINAASSTLVADDNIWTGINTFSSQTSFSTASSTALTSTNLFSTNASTTNLTVSSVPSAILLTNSSGLAGAYAGTSCSNQFVRFINGAGVASCAAVQNADLANSTVSFGGVTLSLGDTDATPAFNLADAINLPILGGTTGTLTVDRGGTGVATLSGLLQGNGTSAISAVTGTAGQFPYYNGANTLAATSSIFLAASGNVGIGTVSHTNFGAGYTTLEVAGTSGGGMARIKSTSIYTDIFSDEANSRGVIRTATNHPLTLWANNNEVVRITSAGNVGIGTTTPTAGLDVVDDGSQFSGIGNFRHSNLTAGVGIGWNGISAIGTNTNSDLTIDSKGSGNVIINANGGANGNVGIGTASPSTKLTIKQSGDTGLNGFPLQIQASGTDTGIFLGYRGSGASFAADTLAIAASYTTTGAYKPLTFSTSDTERMRITTTGNVGIGTMDPGQKLDVAGWIKFSAGIIGGGIDTINARYNFGWNSSGEQGITLKTTSATFNGNAILFLNSSNGASGAISQSANAVAYNTTSDRRLKDNIADAAQGLDALLSIKVRDFNFIGSTSTTQGFIAQELYEIYPYAVTTNGDNGIDPLNASSSPWGVDYGRLTPLIVKAIQDLFREIRDFADGFATNELTFVRATGDEIHVRKLCLDDVCITKSQLETLLSQQGSRPIADEAPDKILDSSPDASPVVPDAPSIEEAPEQVVEQP